MLQSPLSGVAHEVAAACCTLAAKRGSLLDAIARERIAAGSEHREALFAFADALARLRARAQAGASDESLAGFAGELFTLAERACPAQQDEEEMLALAEPVEREPASGLRSHHAHFSASSLNTYAECPRKWFYRYLCAAVEDRGSSASFYGTAFHAALEELHAEFPRPSEAAPQELRRKLEGYVNAAFERFRDKFETAVEFELQRRRAQRTARRYADWLIEQAERAPFTVVGCELSAQLTLEGFDFIGYIDRLDRDDRTGNVTVIDYKTGAIANDAAEYREQVRAFRDFQLPFYYWARTAQGDRVTSLALVPLKDALLDVRPVALEVVPVAAAAGSRGERNAGVISIAELERARARMVELCRELTDGALQRFAVTEDPEACTYCAYAAACAQRPAPLQGRFGR